MTGKMVIEVDFVQLAEGTSKHAKVDRAMRIWLQYLLCSGLGVGAFTHPSRTWAIPFRRVFADPLFAHGSALATE